MAKKTKAWAMCGKIMTHEMVPYLKVWKDKYRIVRGYHNDFDIVDLTTGCSLGMSFPSVLAADRHLADKIISKEFEKYLVSDN